MTFAGGALRDAYVPFGQVFQGAALGIAVTSIMLLFLRQKPRKVPVVAE